MRFAISPAFASVWTQKYPEKMKWFSALLSCLMVFLVFAITSRGDLEKSDTENQYQFVEYPYSVLGIARKLLATLKVHDSMACILQCLRNEQCYSVNFALDRDNQGHLCELIAGDKYRFPYQFKENSSYHHYGFLSLCFNNPCQPGAICRALHRSNGFSCERPMRTIEEAFPWFKANSAKVCFGAKDDSYGTFTMPLSGTVVSLKLVYVSGYVTCLAKFPYGSHWGCKDQTILKTLVTNQKNEVIFPKLGSSNDYTLPGYHTNSSELVFKILPKPVNVAAGEEFRIWYRQDFLDSSEDNNSGHTCTDVYVLMS